MPSIGEANRTNHGEFRFVSFDVGSKETDLRGARNIVGLISGNRARPNVTVLLIMTRTMTVPTPRIVNPCVTSGGVKGGPWPVVEFGARLGKIGRDRVDSSIQNDDVKVAAWPQRTPSGLVDSRATSEIFQGSPSVWGL